MEYSKDNKSVKCQCCGTYIRIPPGRLTKTRNARISFLENRIKYAEAYHNKYGKFDNQIYKQLKQELAQVQKEEQELDRTRHLPLYSSN